MICPNQSNRGPLKEKKELKCGSLPTADIVGAVGKNERKYRHMSIIPFPVCAYATIHYKEGQQMDDWIIYTEDDYRTK